MQPFLLRDTIYCKKETQCIAKKRRNVLRLYYYYNTIFCVLSPATIMYIPLAKLREELLPL